jgi:protein-tyrosine phosphatase
MIADHHLDGQVTVDSAGTGDWHVGKAPDHRAQKMAARRGYDLSSLRARQVEVRDFEHFDYILPMDENNLKDLLAMAPAHHRGKVRLFLEHAPQLGLTSVPDPYYEGEEGFNEVLDLIEAASAGLLAHVRQNLPSIC